MTGSPHASPGWSRGARTVLPAALFLYLVFARTRHITDTFVLLGDQILYWRMALGPWHDLPLAGPSSVGGTTLGPAFVWLVWLSRVLVGPFADNLPHAGGIGIAVFQSAADTLFLAALWRRTGSATLALAVTLLAASSPIDLALSATIWNPPVAAAFVKTTLALVLLEPRSRSIWWGLGATATAVLAVQAHSSAIFVAVPVAASFVLRELVAREWMAAWRRARAGAEVILILEVPYLLNLVVNRPDRVGPSMVIEGFLRSVGGSAALRFRAAFGAVASSTAEILLSPWSLPWFGGALIVCLGVTAFRLRREVTLLFATVIPVVLAVLGFSTWQRGFETYWFLTIAPQVALTVAMALAGGARTAGAVAPIMLAVVIAAQPARLAASMSSHRLPEYGVLLAGTREIRRRMPEIRSIETEFALPPSADREFMYKILGGQVTPQAEFAATIRSSGDVVFRAVSP